MDNPPRSLPVNRPHSLVPFRPISPQHHRACNPLPIPAHGLQASPHISHIHVPRTNLHRSRPQSPLDSPAWRPLASQPPVLQLDILVSQSYDIMHTNTHTYIHTYIHTYVCTCIYLSLSFTDVFTALQLPAPSEVPTTRPTTVPSPAPTSVPSSSAPSSLPTSQPTTQPMQAIGKCVLSIFVAYCFL